MFGSASGCYELQSLLTILPASHDEDCYVMSPLASFVRNANQVMRSSFSLQY